MMTLAAKISMCLALWSPEAPMHSASEGLLSYWYNQQIAIAEQMEAGHRPMLRGPYLPWEELRQLFSLPNSGYIPIPECIQANSEEV